MTQGDFIFCSCPRHDLTQVVKYHRESTSRSFLFYLMTFAAPRPTWCLGLKVIPQPCWSAAGGKTLTLRLETGAYLPFLSVILVGSQSRQGVSSCVLNDDSSFFREGLSEEAN